MRAGYRWGLWGVFALCAGVAGGRIVNIPLWISGGMDGVAMGGAKAPGWLGVSRHVARKGSADFWVDAGGSADWEAVAVTRGLRSPNVVVPSEEALRRKGEAALRRGTVPWTLLNVDVLPQYPEAEVPVPPFRSLERKDGVRVRVVGLLSGGAPLRIPPVQLRPLWVRDPMSALRGFLAASPSPAEEATVVVLPGGADAGEWSRRFPGVSILIEPAGSAPGVVELDDGKRLRVRPGRWGRAVVRVTLRWDTVARAFRNPLAEVEWVRVPDLERVEVPAPLLPRLRPLPEKAEAGEQGAAPDGAVLWAPSAFIRNPRETPPNVRLPDALRIGLLPRDTVWTAWRFTPEEWAGLRGLEVPEPLPPLGSGARPEVWIPARLAAGNGGDAWLTLRRYLDEVEAEPRIVPRTQRERLVPLPASDPP